tara:strand:+ start:228 stop:1034 length:807 start_codon:yes stop_codon:yes gene_type:complete
MKVFTSCVAQKYGDIKADLSQINESSFDATFNKWKELTQGKTPAVDVYRGYSWEFIKSIVDKVPIQIISAGYGIIDIKEPIVPYKITFSNKFFDKDDFTIPTFGMTQEETNKKWFNKLTPSIKWDDNEVTIVTCNPDYLRLLNIPKRDNIIILNNYKLTRLSKWLGAGAHAIANRFAKFIVEEYPNISGDKELKKLFDRLDKKHGKSLRIKRNSVSDEYIIEWANQNKTLTQLREEGYSCSHQRFTRLQDKEWLKNNPDRKFTKQFKK